MFVSVPCFHDAYDTRTNYKKNKVRNALVANRSVLQLFLTEKYFRNIFNGKNISSQMVNHCLNLIKQIMILLSSLRSESPL